MPGYKITAPDGKVFKVNAPEGASQEDVMAYVQKNYQQPAQQPVDRVAAYKAKAAELSDYNPAANMSAGQQALAGAGKSVVDFGRGIKQLGAMGGEKLGLVSPETVSGIQANVDEAKRLDAPLMDTSAGLAGNIGGSIASMLGPGAALKAASMLPKTGQAAGVLSRAGSTLMAPTSIKGAAALGAGMGGVQATASDESRLMNMAAGGIGGGLGQAAGKGLGKLAAPIKSSVEKLRQAGVLESAGVPVSAAQKTGSRALQLIDAAFDNLPATAGKQKLKREVQQQAYNKAVLRSIGAKADTASEEVIDGAFNRLGSQFDDITKGHEVTLGKKFTADLNKVVESQSKLFKSSQSPQIASLLEDAAQVARMGKAPSELIQAERSKLAKMAFNARRSGTNDLAEAYEGLVNAMDGAVMRGLPKAKQAAFKKAKREYGNLKLLTDKNVIDEAGNISPAKFANALKMKNKKAYATGKGGLVKLARAGKETIRGGVGDSGTAQRVMYQNMLTGGAFGTLGGVASQDPVTAMKFAAGGMAAPYVARGLLNSRPVQSYLTKGLMGGKQLNPAVASSARGLLSLGPAAIAGAIQD